MMENGGWLVMANDGECSWLMVDGQEWSLVNHSSDVVSFIHGKSS